MVIFAQKKKNSINKRIDKIVKYSAGIVYYIYVKDILITQPTNIHDIIRENNSNFLMDHNTKCKNKAQ
jgi:hypothetical protein